MSDAEQRARYARDVECAIGLNINPGAAGVYAARDAVLAVRDRETERLRTELRAWADAFAADGADLITKGHVARRISALLEGEQQ